MWRLLSEDFFSVFFLVELSILFSGDERDAIKPVVSCKVFFFSWMTSWWFQTVFIFTPTWGNDPT